MPKAIKVGVITQADGAHLADYFAALASIDEAEAVALADPSGKSADVAHKALGDKLKEVFKDPADLLKRFEPKMAVVSLEAAKAPPAIGAALDAGCHVFAEKPSCTRAADFEKLVRQAQQKHLHLMLAFANRSHTPVREAACIDECAGYFVSRRPVVPTEVEVVEDLLAALRLRGVELRFLRDLWPLRDAVVSSTLRFSLIRMRNAAPRRPGNHAFQIAGAGGG